MNSCRPRQLLGSAVSKTPSKWRGSVTCRRHATNKLLAESERQQTVWPRGGAASGRCVAAMTLCDAEGISVDECGMHYVHRPVGV